MRISGFQLLATKGPAVMAKTARVRKITHSGLFAIAFIAASDSNGGKIEIDLASRGRIFRDICRNCRLNCGALGK
jgi:hypothetical protein